MNDKEQKIAEQIQSQLGDDHDLKVTVSEYVKVKKSDLEELNSRKNDLEGFFFKCIETFNHLEKGKPKNSFDIPGMIDFAKQNQFRMDELKLMINVIYSNHYTQETPDEKQD